MNYFPISVLLRSKQECQRLKGNGIITVLDYMKENKQKLRDRLVFQKMMRQDVDQLFQRLDEEIANLKLTEQDILNQLFQDQRSANQEYLYSNIIPMWRISLIIGDIGSGKTTFLFEILLNYLQNSNNTVVYLDCGQNLAVNRIYSMYRTKLTEQQTRKIFSQIQYHSFDAIKDFEDYIANIPKGQIIFIDGLLTLYAEYDKEIYRLQHSLSELFRYLYSQQNTFVICLRSVQENVSQIQGTKFDQFINCYVSVIIDLLIIKQERVMKIHRGVNPDLKYDQSILFQLKEGGIIQ